MTHFGIRCAAALALTLMALIAPSRSWAQFVPCPANIDLRTTKLPEIVSHGGVLSGTIVLADETRAQVVTKGSQTSCLPQLRRFYENHEVAGPMNVNVVNRPIPGPTLRATVGDIVQLTFLNQIDLLDYGNSIDRYESASGNLSDPGKGCDSVTAPGTYPNLGTQNGPDGKPQTVDIMPNCFHGSSTGNLHFHGTHTNPNGTGDNVFLGVRPSPRVNGVPLVNEAYVKSDFDAFFKECKSMLQGNSLHEWPINWQSNAGLQHFALGPDAGSFKSQETLLKAYDASLPPVTQSPDPRALWPVDEAANARHEWPIYYMGAFPYCFVLPEWPGHNAGAKPHMGQAPGTHWYHAHKHGSTHLNVANGMAGAFIIEGPSYDGMLDAFYNRYRTDTKTGWTRQQTTMVVQQLGGIPNLETNSGGQAAFSINGQINPDITMYPGEVQMWRIVNASAISGFYLPNLPAGFIWRQIAQDGVQFDDINYQARIERPIFVAAGNRIDLLVQASATLKPGSSSTVVVRRGVSVSGAQRGKGTTNDLLTIRIAGSGKPMPLIPHLGPRPSFLDDIAASEVVNKTPRELVFDTAGAASGQSLHTINGVRFDEKHPWVVDKLNVAEEWKIVNTTNAAIDHPFHIHINPFQVTGVFDPNEPLMGPNNQPVKDKAGNIVPVYVISTTEPAKGSMLPGQCWVNPTDKATFVPCAQPNQHRPPYGAKTNIWWDVFPIPAAFQFTPPGGGAATIIPGYFTLRSRFVDYAGNYVMHCHILAHEDRGMMMAVSVATTMTMPQHH